MPSSFPGGFVFLSGIWAHPALRAGPGYTLQQKRSSVFVPLLSLARGGIRHIFL
jgi:hypothetical protein